MIKHAFSGSSGNSGGDLGEQGVLNSISRGIGEWKNGQDLEERGPRGSPWHPYILLFFEYICTKADFKKQTLDELIYFCKSDILMNF